MTCCKVHWIGGTPEQGLFLMKLSAFWSTAGFSQIWLNMTVADFFL